MKLIDRSVKGKATQKPAFVAQLGQTLHRFFGPPEDQAQEVLIAGLQRLLDNQYILLRKISLRGVDITIPLILLGPSGVWVIYASPLKGIYRAKDDQWEKLDGQKLQPARPNLITRTQLMAKAVESYLAERGFQGVEVSPGLFFSDPGIHVDTSRPAVRVIPPDGLQRFASSLIQGGYRVNPETIQRMVNVLAGDLEVEEGSTVIPEKDAFSFRDADEERPKRVVRRVVVQRDPAPVPEKKLPFTRRQWILLAVMVVVNIVGLTALVLLVLLTS